MKTQRFAFQFAYQTPDPGQGSLVVNVDCEPPVAPDFLVDQPALFTHVTVRILSAGGDDSLFPMTVETVLFLRKSERPKEAGADETEKGTERASKAVVKPRKTKER
jgi:hypothetical protein